MTGEGRHRIFIERLLLTAAIVLVSVLLWTLRDLLMLALGAIVIAVLLRVIADPLASWLKLGDRTSTALAVLLVIAVTSLLGWGFGAQLRGQFSQLSDAFPEAWRNLREEIAALPMGAELLTSAERTITDGNRLAARFGDILLIAGNAVTSLIVILFGSVFLAAQPRLYRDGLLLLLPKRRRELGGEALDDAGQALKLWLLGQLISMVIVGILTGVGLWLAGVPSPLALGLIAGLTEGVPYIGPIVASIPGLLLAFLEGPQTAFWALVVYLAVQQIEGNTVTPIVQRRMVTLPPALTLFAIIAAGLVFGLIGVIFATPLLVVVYVLVKRLYVREVLHTPTPIPGQQDEE